MSIATITYTDPVPADMDAEDIGIAEARSNLTEVVAHVRLLKRIKYLKNRTTRVAGIVPVELAELADELGGSDEAVKILKAYKATKT